MKKTLLALMIAVLCFSKSAVAQITVTFENNTPQYFTSVLLDNTFPPGGNPSNYYIDVPNNAVQTQQAIIQTGYPLSSTTVWSGVAFQTYPGGFQSTIIFPTVPYVGTFAAAGAVYNIKCVVLSPTQLYVRIDP